MNMGIQDAYNLAWKLALVMRGVVPGKWFDTYETERRQVAEDVVATTKMVTERAELFASLSPKERKKLVEHMFVPEGEKTRVRRHAEAIDLDYRTSPICDEPDDGFESGPHAGAQAPDVSPILVNGETCTFFDLLRAPNHRLVLFAASTQGDSSTDLANAAVAVVEAHAHWIDAFVVGDQTPQFALPPDVTFIEDQKRSLYQRYGDNTAILYLIRPDGYVTYRLSSLGECIDHSI